jgi:hypothetical protein
MSQPWGDTPTTSAPPEWGHAPPPPRKRRPPWYASPLFWTVTLLGLAAALVFTIAMAGLPQDQPRTAPATTAANRAATPAPTSPPTTEPPAPAYATPTPKDFKLTVKVLQKENFGSAGSNITYRIDAGWSKTFDPAKTYEVTYEVRGGEDGPAINTLTVTGDEYEREREEFISTSSVSQKLTARVVAVEEV